ncbi:MAG: site-2 protease family protein [Chthonomonas sp.]|nr:site-2 protease family protein [Chthonomonas sp.]
MDPELIIRLVIVFLSLAIHEFAHAKLADAAGDPTPSIHGRVTLNPFAHFDPLGSILIIFTAISGFGIGWGKPVPMDPRRMKNPRWDHFWAVLGGPLSNLLQAVVYAIILQVALIGLRGGAGETMYWPMIIAFWGILINVSLFAFNLLPIGPLDGMWILGTFLPERIRFEWTRWNLTVGQFVFLALILIPGTIRTILDPVRLSIARALGVPI